MKASAAVAAVWAAGALAGCGAPGAGDPLRGSRDLLDRIAALRPVRRWTRDPTVSVELPDRASGPVHLRDVQSGVSASARLLDAAPVRGEALDEGVIYWSPFATPGAGAAWVQRPFDGGTEDFVVFESRPPEPRVRYEVTLGTASHVRLVSNVFELLDDTGAPRLRMLPPKVLSASEECLRSGCAPEPVTVSVTGCVFDRDPRAPWRRALPNPEASACIVELSWGADMDYPAVLDPTWSNAQSMMAPRVGHSMNLLPDGDVLVAGGEDPSAETSAELFDSTSLTFSPTGPTVHSMSHHLSARLDDGTVLLIGDGQVDTYANGAFSVSVPPMLAVHTYAAAIRVGTRVLVAPADGAAEIYDPLTEEWTAVPSPFGLTYFEKPDPIVLDDGRVLVGAGLFDPTTLQWTQAAPQPNGRSFARATKLVDGRVLISGGSSFVLFWPTSFNVYSPDPAGGPGQWSTLSPTGGLPRRGHHAVRLASGAVLMVSGIGETYSPTPDVRALDPLTSQYIAYPPRDGGRQNDELVVLDDGRLLLTGGTGFVGDSTVASVLAPDPPGTPCTSAATCMSGFCTDGVCCDATCDAACESCLASEKGSGADGLCAPLMVGAADLACPDEGPSSCGTTGLCAMGGTCAFRERGAACGIDTCVAGAFTTVACDGGGACAHTKIGCAPFVCADGAGCAGTCEGDEGCAAGFTCKAGTCVAKQPVGAVCGTDDECADGLCGDDGACGSPRCLDGARLTLVGGEIRSCSPYTCAEGACRTRCESVLDCSAGNVCNGDLVCVAPAQTVPFGGCALTGDARRGVGFGAAGVGLALLAALVRTRARTSRRARSPRSSTP